MQNINKFKNKFSIWAWAYHQKNDTHDDMTLGSKGRKLFYDTASDIGVDVMIDVCNAYDDCASSGMDLIIMTSVCPDDPNDPFGDVHWGKPTVDGGEVYGNVNQLAWFEQHYGDKCIGYCLNDSCKPCRENDIAASWLAEHAPDKIRYCSYGEPMNQNGSLYPIMSFLNFSFTQNKKDDRSRHKCFKQLTDTSNYLKFEKGCQLLLPIIPASCPDRSITNEEMAYQIKILEDSGADGCVLFPFGTHYSDYIIGEAKGHVGECIKEHALKAKTKRNEKQFIRQ